MKLLANQGRGRNNWRTRVVWLEAPLSGSVEAQERYDVLSSLKNPLKCGVKELRYLEKNVKELNKEEKRAFQDVAGYFFSIAQNSGTKSLPPQMLVQIDSSIVLKSLLPKKLKEQIEGVLDRQVHELTEFVQSDLTNMNATKVARATMLYRRLRRKSYGNAELGPVFENVQKNILGWAIDSLRQASVSTKVKETLDGVSARQGRMKDLKKAEKLLIADIYHMFPDSSSWVDHCDGEVAREYAIEAFEEMKENPGDPKSVLSWNIVEEWMNEDNHEMTSAVGKIFSREDLTKQFGRMRAVELLQFSKTQRVFLPAHLRALNSLRDGNDFVPQRMQEDEWIPQNEKLEGLQEKNRKNEQMQRDLREKNVKEAFTAVSDEERKVVLEKWEKEGLIVDVSLLDTNYEAYKEVKEKQDDLMTDVWTEKLPTWVASLREEWSKEGGIEEIFDRKIEGENESKRGLLTNKKENYEARLKSLEMLDDVSEEDDKKKRDRQEKVLKDFNKLLGELRQVDKDAPDSEKVNEIEDELEDEYAKKYQNNKKQIDDLLRDFPVPESKKEEWQKVKDSIVETEGKIRKEVAENEIYLRWKDIYADPEKFIEKANNNFWGDLNDRVENKHLHAADFDILWEEEFEEDVEAEIGHLPEKKEIMAFREAFKNILPGIFDGVQPPAEDRFDLWYSALDERLSYENILARLSANKYNLNEKFENPQKVSHLLEGAIKNFRTELFEQVKGSVDGDRHDEFYSGWDRLHGRLSGNVEDPMKVHGEHVDYEREKQETTKLIQQEQEKNLAIIENLKERGLDSEAANLTEAWEVRKKWYQNGGRMSEVLPNGETKSFWAPGKSILTELKLQTRSVQSEINEVTDKGLRGPIADLKKEYVALQHLEAGRDKDLKQMKLKTSLKHIFEKWPAQKNKISGLMKDHQTVMEQVLPNGDLEFEFAHNVFETAGEWLSQIDEEVYEWQLDAEKANFEYNGDEACWGKLSQYTQRFENVIDFDKGFFVTKSNSLDNYLERDTKTVEFLDEGNFFEDNSVDKGEFKKVYDERSDKFRKGLESYESSFAKVKSKLQGDMNKLSDEEFATKYGMVNKEYMQKFIEKNDAQLLTFRGGVNEFLHPSFYNSWLRKYSRSAESRVNALEEMTRFQGLADWSKAAGEQTGDMNKWLEEWQPGTGETIKQYRRFALYDIYALVKQAVEVNRHKWEIRSGISVAMMGVGFFGRNSSWGKEFYRKSQEFEGSRVKEIEGEIEEDPWWTNQDQLYESNDQDEVKACINQLIGKGVFKWDDPKLWKTLMRLSGNAVCFTDSDKRKDISSILEKCKDACEFIWSRETFKVWDNSIESKAKSQEDSYASEFQRYEHMQGMREKILGGMLEKWSHGDKANTDPARYAGYIRKAFTEGKMNGGPENDSRWFYLIQGVKYGLLSRDFFNRVNAELLPNMPYFDFFTDKSQCKLDGRLVPEGTPGARPSNSGWIYEDYEAWGDILSKGCEGKFDVEAARKNTSSFFYEVIYQSEDARGRVERMVRGGTKNFDHDDGAMLGPGLGIEAILQMLNKTSTDSDQFTPDFWRNVMAGYEPFFKGIAKYIQEGDAKYGLADKGWQKIRKRNMVDVGDKMKAMLLVFHSIAGNINLTNRASIHFSDNDFEKSEAYSPSALASLNGCNEIFKNVLDVAGKEDEYGFIRDKNEWLGKKGIAPKMTTLKDNGAKQPMIKKLNDLIMGEGGKDVFSEKNIDKMLKGIDTGGGNVMDMFGDMGLVS